MKKTLVIVAALLAGFVASLSAKPAPVPAWLTDKNAVYPTATYITGLGESSSKDGARTEAAAAVARYLKTNVQTATEAQTHAVSTGDAASVSRTLDSATLVSSSLSLSGLEYTEPYYVKKEKRWYCLAFVEREKAWAQCVPTVENAKAAFYALLQKAQAESDPVQKCALYVKMASPAANLLSALDFARLISFEKEAAYAPDRNAASSLDALIEAERAKCTVYIEATGDWSSVFTGAVSGALSQSGFAVSKTKSAAVYTATVTIEANATGTEPLSILPAIDVKIESTAHRTVYAKQIQAEKKTVAYALETAQKKAYPQLADKLKAEMTEELSRQFGLK